MKKKAQSNGQAPQQHALCPGDGWKAVWLSDEGVTEWIAQGVRDSSNWPLRFSPNVKFYNSMLFHISQSFPESRRW